MPCVVVGVEANEITVEDTEEDLPTNREDSIRVYILAKERRVCVERANDGYPPINLTGREGGMQEEADLDPGDLGWLIVLTLDALQHLLHIGGSRADTIVQRSQEHGKEHQVVILNPDHGAGSELLHNGLSEGVVRLPVGLPIFLFEVHLSGVVVEERPKDRVAEAVVVSVCDVIVEIDGLAGVLLHQPLVDDGAILWRNEETRPANPGEGHGLFAAGES